MEALETVQSEHLHIFLLARMFVLPTNCISSAVCICNLRNGSSALYFELNQLRSVRGSVHTPSPFPVIDAAQKMRTINCVMSCVE